MKQWIVVGIGAVLFLAAAGNYVYDVFNDIDNENQAYVSNLNYDFTARIYSVVSLKKGGGYLICQIIRGRCNRSTEDSLNRHLKNFKRIRFLFFNSDDQFVIVNGSADKYQQYDSIYVNSKEDRLDFFTNGEKALTNKITHSTRHKVSFAFWIKD
ncbi:MAG: hypothetical protein QM734_09890 [Cyclobacteriaceae bacterium]